MFDRGLLSLTDGYEILMVRISFLILSNDSSIQTAKFYFLQIEGCTHIRSSCNIIASKSSKAEDGQEYRAYC